MGSGCGKFREEGANKCARVGREEEDTSSKGQGGKATLATALDAMRSRTHDQLSLWERIFYRATNAGGKSGRITGSGNAFSIVLQMQPECREIGPDNWIPSYPARFPGCICSTMENAFPHRDTTRNMIAASSQYFSSISRRCYQPKWVYSARLFVVSARTNKRSSSSSKAGE